MGRKKTVLTNITDPDSIGAWMIRYLDWMKVTNYSERTIISRSVDLHQFNQWCETRGLTRPQDITKPILERYQRTLYHTRKANGQPLSFSRQAARLIALKGLFKWLTKNNYILYNPASEIELPKREHRLPQAILTPDEAEAVLQQPNLNDPLGIRDRAILETFYSTGIRRAELAHLQLHDLDHDRETLFVRQGKGKKDRMVPIGERALKWITKYLTDVRPELSIDQHQTALYLTYQGQPFVPDGLSFMVRDYVKDADLGKGGACHLFRHTMATAMLENGADVRFIQEMLGHANLATTQQYTHVSIAKLKEIHTATHPAARLTRRRIDDADDEGKDEDC
jgi:integrase/recombinase XerD